MKKEVARHARGLPLLGTMARHVAGYFKHPKLRQIVQYTLVFLGGAPRNTPALYSLMGHVDFNLGVYYPAGGIGALVDALETLAKSLGVEIRLNQEVEAIEKTDEGLRVRVRGHVSGDKDYTADFVVSNADYLHTERDLLKPSARQYSRRYWRRRVWAPSAFLLYLGVEGDVPELLHHSLVIPEDWEPHFDSIFDKPAWPDDPAYYLCVPSKTDASVAPPGHSNLFVLVPLAAGLEDGPETRAAYREHILADIAKNTGEDLRERIVFEQSFCVSDFRSRYNAAEGSALGLAHTLTQSAFTRPRRRSTKLPGLYFSGSYTTPGIGVPMCLIGGEHTARTMLEDHGRPVEPAGSRSAETLPDDLAGKAVR
jgi:phytoene desaturase